MQKLPGCQIADLKQLLHFLNPSWYEFPSLCWTKSFWMLLQKIIFDFDHTLVEFGAHVEWRGAIQKIEEIYLDEGIPRAVVEQSKGIGFKLMRSVHNYMLGVLRSERVIEVQSRVFAALEEYELLGVGKAKPLEGAENLLSWLRVNGYQCAIVSSNGTRAIEHTLEHLKLGGFFVRVFGRDASSRLKPYPDQNQLCLTSLRWNAKETLLVGDSPDDILSASLLSIFTVGIVSGFVKREKLLEAGANRTIQNLAELPSLLQSM
jgi:HAD superfamily hydrolase (TIGR01549 family)